MGEPERICGSYADYIGKCLLAGVTYLKDDGEVDRREQFYGTIVVATEFEIVVERSDTGDRMSFPPEVEKAEPGEYRLRSTGEVVVNPDYLASWTVTPPPKHP
jgi:hypothetical protein